MGGRLHKVLVQFRLELWFPWLQITPIGLKWGKRRHRVFSTVFNQILFILAGTNDIHKSLDVFEIWPDWTMDYGVSCP